MRHVLKTWPSFFKALQTGEKTFELKKNDRDFKVGDTLLLQEFNPRAEPTKQYTGEELEFTITYILGGHQVVDFGLERDFVIMGIKQKELIECNNQLDAATRSALQLCPKCNGQGIVSKPPWVAGDVHQWTSSATSFTCDVCNGAKVI